MAVVGVSLEAGDAHAPTFGNPSCNKVLEGQNDLIEFGHVPVKPLKALRVTGRIAPKPLRVASKWGVYISNSCFGERTSEGTLREARFMAPRRLAHVDNNVDALLAQN